MKSFFVIGNPGHHAAMMVPVMRELVARGHAVDVLSVAELRGLPPVQIDVEGVFVHTLFPRRLRQKGVGRAGGTPGASRKLMREVLWRTVLMPALRWQMMWLPDVVVLPNDVAFPYDRIRALAQSRKVATVLVQEGIRFPTPLEQLDNKPYGGGGCSVVCAWGTASAAHFVSAGAPRERIAVTGNPRFDAVDVAALRGSAPETRARHGLGERTLLYLSNPVEDQGFMTTAAKMRLFAQFLQRASPVLEESDATLAVKVHAREDVAAFKHEAATATAARPAVRIKVLEDAALYPLLAAGCGAVVLSSTVGLEALLLGLPLGVIALPGYGPVHDYVRSGAGARLDVDEQLPAKLRALLDPANAPSAETRAAYVDSHLAHRGDAARLVADAVARSAGGRSAA